MVQSRSNNPHPTSSHIEAGKNMQGPAVDRTKQQHIDKEFSEQRDTMKPEHGVKMEQQQARELKEKGESPNVDLSADVERTDVPAQPAEIKGGMRK